MAASKQELLKVIDVIINSDIKNKEEHFGVIFQNFKKKYERLFTMVCQESVDMPMLNYLLDMMDKIYHNDTSQNDASVEVGKELFAKYVDVSKLTPSDTPFEGGPKVVIKNMD
jgi:hypothetical protein